ncbi:L,D-transpeptidase family protein [Luteolibacter sp. AS25]|uniref:L,D-transpeptidase family protein n=1 Tax=Luteolibacter sp. AS25 TaxID=3135776 RepID=UPI00398BA52E
MLRPLSTFVFIALLSAKVLAQSPLQQPGTVMKALPLNAEGVAVPPTQPLTPGNVAGINEIEPAPLSVNPIELKPTGENAVRLQIFLDHMNFGPGVIDGKIGQFSELAVKSWNEANGYPIDSWREVNLAAQRSVPNPFATAIVPAVVKDWVNPNLPYKKAEQAKVKRMSYRSNGEFMSERYHTDVPYLISLNSSSKINNLSSGDSIIVPNVSAFQIENLTGAAFKEDEALSQRHAVIDTKLNQVRIYEANLRALIVADPEADTPARVANQSLVAVFPITPGKPQFIRYGKWKMQNAVELPVWRYDQTLLDTGKRSNNSLNIPGGPNNPVGVLWCGLSKPGIGMHGTSDPETIGRSRSSGCIRLANWDIVRIPGMLRPGCSVEIR